jgi:hypothetical protein
VIKDAHAKNMKIKYDVSMLIIGSNKLTKMSLTMKFIKKFMKEYTIVLHKIKTLNTKLKKI